MTLRPEYSLGHSSYNDFLFATVAVERHGLDTNGTDLTVLSALTRLQVDPWHEAARLANLPPDAASSALAATFARLPDLNWKADDAAATARRLVALLPASAVRAVPLTPEAAAADRKAGKAASGRAAYPPAGAPAKPAWTKWLIWTVLAVAALTIAIQLQPDNNLEPSSSRSETVRQ